MLNSLFPQANASMKDILHEDCLVDFDKYNYAVPLPNTAKPGHSAIYRHPLATKGLINRVHSRLDTVYALFENALALWPANDFIGTRLAASDGVYTWSSYETISKRRTNLGAGLIHAIRTNVHRKAGQDPESFTVALYSANTPEWALTDLACISYSLCNTALYDTLGPDTTRYILDTTASPVVVCSNDKLEGLLSIKDQLPLLIQIITMEPLSAADQAYVSKFAAMGATLCSFADIESLGERNPLAHRPPTPETLYTLSFTSGTTGNPKGVVLRHLHAASAVTSFLSVMPIPPGKAREYLFLPLSHIYERSLWCTYITKGAACGFPLSNSPAALLNDMRLLKPTSFISVPRVFTRFESVLKEAISDAAGSGPKLNAQIIERRTEWIKSGQPGRPSWLFDPMLTNRLRSLLGLDNAKYLVTGSAPISAETINFFKAALDVGFAQGYGMTESFAGLYFSNPFEVDAGSCGPIGVTAEVRLRDVPEMGYASTDAGGARGEVLIRGPQIFEEYYKDPAETRDAFDEDGWYRTGDIGRLDDKGRVYVVDRVKSFQKLSQGEYVSPERSENAYLSGCQLISQIYIHGDPLQSYLVGVAGIDPVAMRTFLDRECGVQVDAASTPALLNSLKDPKIKLRVIRKMNESVAHFKLQGFEKVHNIFFDVEPLTVARNVVTPTFKIKRPIARTFFKDVLHGLYQEGSMVKEARL